MLEIRVICVLDLFQPVSFWVSNPLVQLYSRLIAQMVECNFGRMPVIHCKQMAQISYMFQSKIAPRDQPKGMSSGGGLHMDEMSLKALYMRGNRHMVADLVLSADLIETLAHDLRSSLR